MHKSHDGTRLVNYAQWRSREDFEAIMTRDEVQPPIQQAADVAESYDPIFCDLVDSTPHAS